MSASKLVFCGWLLVAACGDGGVGGRPGDFGQVTATPECGALSLACIGQGLDAPIARGSRVDLAVAYKVAGSSGPPTVIATADPTVIVATGPTQLEARGSGMSAILFVGPNEDVIDLLHVWVQEASELQILRYDNAGDLLGRVQPASQLLRGDEILIAVEPFANGQPLLGNFDLAFASTNPSSLAIVPDPVGGWYRVVARAEGVATLTFQALDRVVRWDVEVLP